MAVNKKIPMRKCVGCGEMKPKKDLVRVVKAPDAKDENGQVLAAGGVSVDATGRKNGRGAYICPSMDCFKKAVKGKGLERSFKQEIPQEVYEKLAKEMERIGQR